MGTTFEVGRPTDDEIRATIAALKDRYGRLPDMFDPWPKSWTTTSICEGVAAPAY